MYIIAGPGQVLGFNESTGEFKIINAAKGDVTGATPEEILEYKRGPFNALAAKELNQGFEPLDISQMDFNKRLEMRDKAEQIMGPNAMAHISNSNKFNTALKEATNQLKKIFGGAKLPGMLGILDILGMKKEYDQIVEGTHPSGITMTEEEFKEKFGNQVYADGGYVTYPFVKDIFDN